MISSGSCLTLDDKRQRFIIFIVNFPFLCDNVSATPAYGGFI